MAVQNSTEPRIVGMIENNYDGYIPIHLFEDANCAILTYRV